MANKDKRWEELNKELIEHAKNWNWGLYRNTRLEMYRFLKKEGHDKQALQTLLEVCYLDINGHRNCGGIFDSELLAEFPPWKETNNWQAPTLFKWINKLSKKLEYTLDDIHSLFIKVAKIRHDAMKLPVSPDKAWEKLSKELKGN